MLTPSKQFIDQLNSLIKDFNWRGKRPKIKHSTLVGDYEEGGYKDVDIKVKIMALKIMWINVGSMEAPVKVLLLFFLFSDWLDPKHLKSRIERGFLDIFSRHMCSTFTERARVTNYETSYGAKKCSEKPSSKLLR